LVICLSEKLDRKGQEPLDERNKQWQVHLVYRTKITLTKICRVKENLGNHIMTSPLRTATDRMKEFMKRNFPNKIVLSFQCKQWKAA